MVFSDLCGLTSIISYIHYKYFVMMIIVVLYESIFCV